MARTSEVLCAALVGTALTLLGCDAPAPQQQQMPTVTVARPVQKDVAEYIHLTGTAEPVENVEVRPRVEGHITEVLFTEGDRVEEGDVLYHIDERSLQVALQRAQADLQNAQVKLDEAADEHGRYLELKEEGVVSELEYNRVRANWLSAQETASAAAAAVENAEINLDYAEVRAPISGRVGENFVTVGNLVNGLSGPLTEIYTYDPIHVVFSLSERELIDLRERHARAGESPQDTTKTLEMGLLGSETFPIQGELDFAALGIDPQTGTYEVQALVPNPDGVILPGQYIRIRGEVGSKPGALLVPEVALGLDQTGRFLLVVDGQGTVAKRSVSVGPAEGTLVVIESGLEPTDRVIINGLQRARPGSNVNVEETTLSLPPATEG